MTADACDIRLDHVVRRFDGRPVVDAVSVTFPAGQTTALIGASGSGKSTLLRLVAGLERLDGGQILFGDALQSGANIHVAPEHRRVGFVFQDFALFPHLTAGENVGFGVPGLSREERLNTARRRLADVELAHRIDAYPHELSGGEQQRVALARALAPAPRAILLDEPFSGLDPGLRASLRERMVEAIAATGATTVFVTHDAEEAMLVADRVAILKDGKLVQDGPPRAVYDAPLSLAAAAALGPVNVFPAHATGGAAHTPFGAFESTSGRDSVDVVVRLEDLGFSDTGAPVRVIERRPCGAHDIVRVTAGGVIWKLLARPSEGAQAGAEGKVAARRAHVFPR